MFPQERGSPVETVSHKTGDKASPRVCLDPTTSQGDGAENTMGGGTIQLWLLEVLEGSF